VNSVLNLLSLYHDTLLARRLALVKSNSKVPSELIPPSPHTRYTKAWSEKDALYRWSARGLEAIRFSQLVIEMILKRVTRRNGRWRGIVLLELAK
jgi:peroxin-16